jgi:hypothetical protein
LRRREQLRVDGQRDHHQPGERVEHRDQLGPQVVPLAHAAVRAIPAITPALAELVLAQLPLSLCHNILRLFKQRRRTVAGPRLTPRARLGRPRSVSNHRHPWTRSVRQRSICIDLPTGLADSPKPLNSWRRASGESAPHGSNHDDRALVFAARVSPGWPATVRTRIAPALMVRSRSLLTRFRPPVSQTRRHGRPSAPRQSDRYSVPAPPFFQRAARLASDSSSCRQVSLAFSLASPASQSLITSSSDT